MLIVISGTPGTGKTALALFLAKKLGYYRLDLSSYYKQISSGYDRKKQCYVVDLKKFTESVKRELKQHPKMIIDSHIAHTLPKKIIDLCIVLICSDLKRLKKRLQKKHYPQQKIRENLDAEIFQVCLAEAVEKGLKVILLDTSKKTYYNALLSKLKQSL